MRDEGHCYLNVLRNKINNTDKKANCCGY